MDSVICRTNRAQLLRNKLGCGHPPARVGTRKLNRAIEAFAAL